MAAQDLKLLFRNLEKYYANAGQAQQIIISSALVAAGADAVGGIIPGLAIPALIVSCFGTIWVMYGKLCKTLGISMKENVLKLLARAALANISANLGGVMIAFAAGMLIPGASIVVSATVSFITVYLAGQVFLQMVLKMAEKSADPHSFRDISESEMASTIRSNKLTREDFKAAKSAYQSNK